MDTTETEEQFKLRKKLEKLREALLDLDIDTFAFNNNQLRGFLVGIIRMIVDFSSISILQTKTLEGMTIDIWHRDLEAVRTRKTYIVPKPKQGKPN